MTWLGCTANLAQIGRPERLSDLVHTPCGPLCDRVNARLVSSHPIAVACLHVQPTAWADTLFCPDWRCPAQTLYCTDGVLRSPIQCPAWTYTTWLSCTANLTEMGRPARLRDLVHAPFSPLCDQVNARWVSSHPIAVACLHVQLTAWADTLFCPDWRCPAQTVSCTDVVLHRRCPALTDTTPCLDLYDLANLHGHLD